MDGSSSGSSGGGGRPNRLKKSTRGGLGASLSLGGSLNIGSLSSRSSRSSSSSMRPASLMESLRAETMDRRNFLEREASAMKPSTFMSMSFSSINEEEEEEDNESVISFEARVSKMVEGLDEGEARQKISRAKAFRRAIRKSRYRKKAKGLVTTPLTKTLRQWKKLRRYFASHRHELRAPIFFVLWLTWLLGGTLFYGYAPQSNLGFIMGFYMSLNIGYSIGFGFPTEADNNYLWFSSIYVLMGASFVGAALGFFADKVNQDSENWFTRMEQQRKIEDAIKANNNKIQGKIKSWLFHYSSAIRALGIWLSFILSMITYSMAYIQWDFRQAQYFAISSLSTGGHWMIPKDSPDWLFGLTGLFIMFGVPIMATAMATTAYVVISNVDIDEAKATIDAVVTKEELEFLDELGMDEFDGTIDRAEFMILCMVRMGTDPGLIAYITQRFMELGFYTGEPLRVAEITQGAHKFHNGQIRRRSSLMSGTEVLTEYEAAMMSLSSHRYDDRELEEEEDNEYDYLDSRRSSARSSGRSHSSVRFADLSSSSNHSAPAAPGEMEGSTHSAQSTVRFADDCGLDLASEEGEGSSSRMLDFVEANNSKELLPPINESLSKESVDDDCSANIDLVTREPDLEAPPQQCPAKPADETLQPELARESSFLKRLIEKFRVGLDDASHHISTASTSEVSGEEMFADEPEMSEQNDHNNLLHASLRRLATNLQEECIPFGSQKSTDLEELPPNVAPNTDTGQQSSATSNPPSSTANIAHATAATAPSTDTELGAIPPLETVPSADHSEESKHSDHRRVIEEEYPLSAKVRTFAKVSPLVGHVRAKEKEGRFQSMTAMEHKQELSDDDDPIRIATYNETVRIRPPSSPPPIEAPPQYARYLYTGSNNNNKNRYNSYGVDKTEMNQKTSSLPLPTSQQETCDTDDMVPSHGRPPGKACNYARFLYTPMPERSGRQAGGFNYADQVNRIV